MLTGKSFELVTQAEAEGRQEGNLKRREEGIPAWRRDLLARTAEARYGTSTARFWELRSGPSASRGTWIA